MNWNKSFINAINSAIVFALIACSSKPIPETQAAILTLKGLNSKLDVGINLVGYADELRDANVVVDQALESDPKSKNNQVMEKVMDLHLAALELMCQPISLFVNI
jgi:Tfp pilus assembly protein PilF